MSGGAEMIAGAVVQHVAGMLGQAAWERVELLWCFKDDVEEMKDNLLTLQDVLGDAENRSRGKEAAPERRWLKKVKSVAYNMEDALQELETNAMIWKNSPCTALHAWYLAKTQKKGCDTGITVRYEDKHFFNGTRYFVVGFNDLFELFNLVGLDVSLLRCWTLYMLKNVREWKEPVGFLDPHVVSLQTIQQDSSFVEKYITRSLLRQTNMKYIVVPYNQGYHWILVVIIPKRNHVIYLDSLNRNKHDFSTLRGILERSFINYVANKGIYNRKSAQLTHRMDFPCRQQKDDELCAIYVCYHMQLILTARKKDPEALNLQCDSLVAEEIKDIRGKLCAFINTEIINDNGEFHSVANPEHHPTKTSQRKQL